jgi:hypothetical protein
MNSLDLFYPSPIFRREEAREIQSLPLKSGMVPASDDVFNDIKRYRQNACCYFGDAPTLKLFSKSTRSCSLIHTHTHTMHTLLMVALAPALVGLCSSILDPNKLF